MSGMEIIKSPETNWSSFLEQVQRDYNTFPALGIAHGLQKDAIQNGWGARINNHNWTFEFRLIKSTDGKFILTMTDHGTHGLIGDPCYFEKKAKTSGETAGIPEKEKLARFESMFYSGGSGVGLFGRGKLLFNVASKQKLIFYDSLTIDKQYRLNKRQISGSEYNQYKCVLQGDLAKAKLYEWLNGLLQPLTSPGTRIVIVEPIQEVLDAIHNGDFLKAIEETWWEIIQKFDAKITVVDDENRVYRAKVPKDYATLPKETTGGWRVYYKANVEVKVGSDVYKIKHLHFLLAPKNKIINPELQGVNVHRRGMKIGSLQLEIPEEISDRFFGYVQLDEDFENLVSETESITHYGFASIRKSPIRDLRNTVREDFEVFMQQLGFGPNTQEQNEKAKKLLEKAKAELDNILRDMGIPSLTGGRSNKQDLSISIINLNFPNNTNYVNIGDVISGFKYKITNRSIVDKNTFFEVTIRGQNATIDTLIPRKALKIIGAHPVETEPLTISIKDGVYPRGKRVSCVATITDEKQKTICQKTFYLYIDIMPPKVEEFASITLTNADWPHEKSRRVDYNEKIMNLIYEIENLTPTIMKAKVKVGTIWAEERERIEDVFQIDLTLTPYETKTFLLPEIYFSKQKYSEVDKGKMILRCHAVALEKTSMWENRSKLEVNDVIFYLNKDPGYGFFEDQDYTSSGPDKPRSEVKPMEGGRWKMWINNTHPAYEVANKDPIMAGDYIFEEMARQTVYVLLQKGDSELITKLAKLANNDVDDFSPSEILKQIAYPITDHILSIYYSGR
jgi:hypothetical protein